MACSYDDTHLHNDHHNDDNDQQSVQKYNAAMLLTTARDTVRAEADKAKIMAAWHSIEQLVAYEDSDIDKARKIITFKATARTSALADAANDIVTASLTGVKYVNNYASDKEKQRIKDLTGQKDVAELRLSELRLMPDVGDILCANGRMYMPHPNGDAARDRERTAVKVELNKINADLAQAKKYLAWPWYNDDAK